jgi:hypothetical protein
MSEVRKISMAAEFIALYGAPMKRELTPHEIDNLRFAPSRNFGVVRVGTNDKPEFSIPPTDLT